MKLSIREGTGLVHEREAEPFAQAEVQRAARFGVRLAQTLGLVSPG